MKSKKDIVTKVTSSMILDSPEIKELYLKTKRKILKSPEFIEAIKENINDTISDGKEHGFVICSNDKYTITNKCTGTECEITVPTYKESEKICKTGKMVGTHHTHPIIQLPFFSVSDIEGFIAAVLTDKRNLPHNEYIECVSSIDNRLMPFREAGETICYIPYRKITKEDYYKEHSKVKQNPNQFSDAKGFVRLAIVREKE